MMTCIQYYNIQTYRMSLSWPKWICIIMQYFIFFSIVSTIQLKSYIDFICIKFGSYFSFQGITHQTGVLWFSSNKTQNHMKNKCTSTILSKMQYFCKSYSISFQIGNYNCVCYLTDLRIISFKWLHNNKWNHFEKCNIK